MIPLHITLRVHQTLPILTNVSPFVLSFPMIHEKRSIQWHHRYVIFRVNCFSHGLEPRDSSWEQLLHCHFSRLNITPPEKAILTLNYDLVGKEAHAFRPSGLRAPRAGASSVQCPCEETIRIPVLERSPC